MGWINRLSRAVKKPDNRALLASLALVGTYALAAKLEAVQRPIVQAARPRRRGWSAWKHIAYRTYVGMNDDRLLALAAGVVFYGLLAIFPAVTALVSSYALFANVSTIAGHLAAISTFMPQSAYRIIDEQVIRIVTTTTGGLSFAFLFGLALALWSANAGVKAIIDALNIVYGVKERRGFIWLNLLSLTFTAGAIAGLLTAIAAVVVLPVVLSYLPFGNYSAAAIAWLRWPALLLLVMLGLAVLYRFGPNRANARWQFFSAGVSLASLAWLGGSALLSWYLGNFANYDATYGSLGAGIGLMMWLWMTAIVVLLGAELNSEIEAASAPPRADEESLGAN